MADERVRIVHSDGRFATVPKENLGEAEKLGWHPEQAQESAERQRGTTLEAAGQGLVAGTVGAALAAPKLVTALGTMGANALGADVHDPLAPLSGRRFLEDMAAVKAHLTGGESEVAGREARESIIANQEANPYAFGAGELGGAIAGSGGLSAGARGIAGAGARALGLGGTAARVASGVGAGVLEGGALGADAASEAAWVKNAPATAQQTLAAIGLGALFGGGVSLAAAGASKLPAVAKLLRRGETAEGIEGAELGEELGAKPVVAAEEKAAPAALENVDEGFIAKGRRYVNDLSDEAAVDAISRGNKPALKRLGAGAAPSLAKKQETGALLHEMGVLSPGRSESDMFDIAEQQAQQNGRKMGAVLEQADKEGAYVDGTKIMDRLDDVATRIEKDSKLAWGPEGEQTANFVRDRLGTLQQKAEAGVLTHSDLHDFRMYLDGPAYERTLAEPLKNAAREMRSIVSEELGNAIEGVSSDLRREWQQANARYGAARWAADTLGERVSVRNGANRLFSPSDYGTALATAVGAGNPLLGITAGLGNKLLRERGYSTFAAVAKKLAGEAVDVSAAPAAATNTARKLSALVAHSTETVESGVTRFLNGEKPSAVGRAVRAAPTLISRMRSGDIRDARAAYADQVREIQTVASTPEVAFDRMQKITGNVVPTYAPGLHAEMVATAERCANYLSAHAPAPAQDPNTITPQVKTSPPVSAADMTKFADRCEGAMDPLSFLRDLNSVTGVSPEKQDAVKQCHPALFEQIQQSIFTHCAARTTPLSYKQSVRLDLALDAGGTISPSLNPKNLATMQLASASVAKAMTKPSGGAAPKVSGMLATRSQQISGGFR